jgi:hypothetical protein
MFGKNPPSHSADPVRQPRTHGVLDNRILIITLTIPLAPLFIIRLRCSHTISPTHRAKQNH